MKINAIRQRLFIQEEISYECKFESILVLNVVKESERALFSVQNVSTACTRGVLEYIEVQPERKILHAKNAFLVCNSDKILNLNGDNI